MTMAESPEQQLPWYRRIELMSLVHLAFFVLAVMSPSLITHDYFGIPQHNIEEVFIFLFGLAGLVTFSLHQRVVEQRTHERDAAKSAGDRAKHELIESYKYIGSVNRQIEVLKQFANQTSMAMVKDDVYWKDLLGSLTANAASSANASTVLLRFVDVDTLRTESEVAHAMNKKQQFNVANKELRKLHDFGSQHAFMRTDDGREILVVPSDRKQGGVKAFLLLVTDPSRTSDIEASIVKVFANQAELIYHSLAKKKDEAPASDAALTVDAITSKSVGEVR